MKGATWWLMVVGFGLGGGGCDPQAGTPARSQPTKLVELQALKVRRYQQDRLQLEVKAKSLSVYEQERELVLEGGIDCRLEQSQVEGAAP